MSRRLPALLPPLLSALLVLAACGGDDPADDDPAPGARATTTTTGAPDGGDPEPDAEPDLEAVAVHLTRIADLNAPIALAVRSGDEDTLYVAERGGTVRTVRDGSVSAEPVLDLSDRTTTDSERGLLGLTFSPDGSHLYVSYTGTDGHSRLDEYRMDSDRADTGTRRQVLMVEQPYSNHNGGDVTFGPDGYLWLGLGDGGAGGDPHDHGQNPATRLGAMLRIAPEAVDGDPYAIPDDNPFADGGGRPEVWAYGLRNPWRFSFDRATGDLWIADVGQADVEEVNLVPAGTPGGVNLGWNRLEGSRPFEGDPPDEHMLPVFEYDRVSPRCSVTGGYVYRGEAIPELRGAYLWGDYCESEVHAIVVSDGEVTAERSLGLSVDTNTLGSFGQDADGELYVLSLAGGLYRIDPAG